MADIHEFLRTATSSEGSDQEALDGEIAGHAAPTGSFLPGGDPRILARVGALARTASYVVQGLTVVALVIAATISWASWLHLTLALTCILSAGLVGVLMLLGVHARIALLVDVEANTRRIARNKERIADLLERIWVV